MKVEKRVAVIEHSFLHGFILLELANKEELKEAKKLLQEACAKKDDPEVFKAIQGIVSYVSYLKDTFDDLN